MKKIRLFYWKLRDRGHKKQVMLCSVVLVLLVLVICGCVIYRGVKNWNTTPISEEETDEENMGEEVEEIEEETDEENMGEEVEEIEEETDEEDEEETDMSLDDSSSFAPEDVSLNGISTFLGFMPDDSYDALVSELTVVAAERECQWIKRMEYQEVEDFDVASFVLFADGSVFECDYNLKSDTVSVKETDYTEEEIIALNNEKLEKEQKKLEKEQKAEKKKTQAKSNKKNSSSKKNSKKKTNKKNSKKKASEKKSSTKNKNTKNKNKA